LSLGGTSPYASTNQKVGININKSSAKITSQTIQNTVNTSTHITKKPTHTHT